MTRRIDSPDTSSDLELQKNLALDEPHSFVMRAGAGSGKTTSLIKALDFVAKKRGRELKANRQQVVCITYTEIATEEIRHDVGENPLVHVSTIHSFLWQLIRPFHRDISSWVEGTIRERIASLEEEQSGFASKPRTRNSTIERNALQIEDYTAQLESINSVPFFTYSVASNYREGMLGHDDIIKMVPQLILNKPLLATLVSQRYPFFFVDESQDTAPLVVEALKSIAAEHSDSFCLGFFGDPMQKIYATGVGDIEPGDGWREFDKPENFRCSQAVLRFINRIRSQGDDLIQTGGLRSDIGIGVVPVEGTARLVVLPADEERYPNLDKVRAWLAEQNSDPLWKEDSPTADLKILVIVHRMAANRLGFPNLYGAFNDKTSDEIKDGFQQGDFWPLAPLTKFVLPLTAAHQSGNDAEVLAILRTQSPQLLAANVARQTDAAKFLRSLRDSTEELSKILASDESKTVRDVLSFVEEKQLLNLDRRLIVALAVPEDQNGEASRIDDDDQSAVGPFLDSYLACPVSELRGYRDYFSKQSPYATQQGIKGAEFERVVVILDEVEGRHIQFSYEKLLGLKELSETDSAHRENSEDSVVERTLRLFYVCCSRARRDLVVVLYSAEPDKAAAHLRSAGGFQETEVLTIEDLQNTGLFLPETIVDSPPE